ncbi:MAG: hypothetical protein CM15mP127_06760 [Gammaproteobacteria bacterium]|nr:MAG: hypothetical protein CM15mP127_06760 [Gammaproteobacteria bacterium]
MKKKESFKMFSELALLDSWELILNDERLNELENVLYFSMFLNF